MANTATNMRREAQARGRAKAAETAMEIGAAIVLAQSAAVTLGRQQEIREIAGARQAARFIVREAGALIYSDEADVIVATRFVVRFRLDGAAVRV